MVADLRRRFPGLPILHLADLSRPIQPLLPDDVPTLPKPFSVNALLTAVDQLLERL